MKVNWVIMQEGSRLSLHLDELVLKMISRPSSDQDHEGAP